MLKLATVVVAAIAATSVMNQGPARAQQAKDAQGRDALMASMMNEAYSAAKYKLFAEHARDAGRKDLADLMARAANMEYGHFLRWAELYRLVGTDAQNIQAAVRDDVNDDVKFYDRLAAEAEARGDKALAEHFHQVEGQEQRQDSAFKDEVGRLFPGE